MRADELRALLARLEIPVEALSVLGVRRCLGGSVAIHLVSAYFWRVVKRTGGKALDYLEYRPPFRFATRTG